MIVRLRSRWVIIPLILNPTIALKHNLATIAAAPDFQSETLARDIASSIEVLKRSALYHHASNRMAEIGCSLELFKRAHQEYPERLEQLVPAFLSRLPHDPCTGLPFIYKREPKSGYLLYSVGLNNQDDGGVMPSEGATGNPDWRWFAPVRE